MRVTAHRGFAMDNVENTVCAVEDAVSSGVVDAVKLMFVGVGQERLL